MSSTPLTTRSWLEVCHWTNFADAFTHLSEGRARVEDLDVSVCAVLLAEACNISLAAVAHPGVPALTYARLSWVSQNYVRAETIGRSPAAGCRRTDDDHQRPSLLL